MFKKNDSDGDTTQIVIESVQPKQCCLHPHEGCAASSEFIAYEQHSKDIVYQQNNSET